MKKFHRSPSPDIFLDEEPECRNEFCRNNKAIDLSTGELRDIICKSWRCPKCAWWWGWKWSLILNWQLKRKPTALLINLTTAEMITAPEAAASFRAFFRAFRDMFGPTEYIKLVEYNKKHTQPHFHFIIMNDMISDIVSNEVMPKAFKKKKLSWPIDIWEEIKSMWVDAQITGFTHVLNSKTREVLGIKRITKVLSLANEELVRTTRRVANVAWCQPVESVGAATKYVVGYVTGSNKNETPDESWQGRRISFSRGFFEKSTIDIFMDCKRENFLAKNGYPLPECTYERLDLHLDFYNHSFAANTVTVFPQFPLINGEPGGYDEYVVIPPKPVYHKIFMDDDVIEEVLDRDILTKVDIMASKKVLNLLRRRIPKKKWRVEKEIITYDDLKYIPEASGYFSPISELEDLENFQTCLTN